MDNKIYKCALCGKEYQTIQERNACETKCLAWQKEEEKKAAEAKRKAERDKDEKEITMAYENVVDLVQAFVKKYGHYPFYNTVPKNLDAIPTSLLKYLFN